MLVPLDDIGWSIETPEKRNGMTGCRTARNPLPPDGIPSPYQSRPNSDINAIANSATLLV
jgi:hypothetical protein